MKLKLLLFVFFLILIGFLFVQCPEQGSNSGGCGGDNDKNVTTAVFQNIWTILNPLTKPSARRGHSMVYVENNKIILFGGIDDAGYNDETWE